MFTRDAKIRNFPVSLLPRFPGFQPLTISTKSFILDVWQGFEYTSDPDIPWFFPDISQTSCKENQSIWTRNWIINKKTFKENITHINYVTKENHTTFLLLSALPLMQLLIICKQGKVTASSTSGFLYCKDSKNRRTTGKKYTDYD